MKRIILYLFVLILLISCQDAGKGKPKNKASDNTGAPKTDSTTAAWLLKNDPSGKVFLNTIRLKDGQEETAGLSFFLRMDSLKFIVSAKHLLGPASGFSQEIAPPSIGDEVTNGTHATSAAVARELA